MNWAVIFVIMTMALSMLVGYRKGFLRIVYSLVSWMIIMAFVSWATPYIQTYLMEQTPVYEMIRRQCDEAVRKSDTAAGEFSGTAVSAAGERNTAGEQLARLGIQLPEAVADRLFENITEVADSFLEESGIYEEISKGLAYFAVEGIAFVIALVSSWLFVHVIAQLLGIVSHIPVIKGANRVLGLFAGGVYGLMVVWIVFYFIALCSASELGSAIISDIYKNPLLASIYENNIIFILILNYFPG